MSSPLMSFCSHHTQENRGFSIVKSIQTSVLRFWSYFAVLTYCLADCFGTQSLRASVLSPWLCKSTLLTFRFILTACCKPDSKSTSFKHFSPRPAGVTRSRVQQRRHLMYFTTLSYRYLTPYFHVVITTPKAQQANSSIIVRKSTYYTRIRQECKDHLALLTES